MTTQEYLMQVKDIDLRIRSLEGELNDSDNEEDEEYAEELRNRIESNIEQYKELRTTIREQIQQLKDNRSAVLLTEYYVRGRSWEQVAAALDMRDVRNVRKGMHKKALQLFSNLFQNIYENTVL